MPYDGRNFEVKTKPDVFSLEGLIAWLEQQPGETKYDYADPRDCLLCRYFRDRGIDVVDLGPYDFTTPEKEENPYPYVLASVANNPPNYTYAAVLDRARTLLAEREQ